MELSEEYPIYFFQRVVRVGKVSFLVESRYCGCEGTGCRLGALMPWINSLEQKNIRFIASGDNVDSAQGAYNLTVPVLDMMNDYYACGIFAKTKDARAIRARLGQRSATPTTERDGLVS